MLDFIGWLVLGALAGWIASLIMGTNRQQGCLIDIIVGIIGAFVGGFIFDQLDFGPEATGLNLPSLLVAVVGAVILLFIVKLIQRNR